MELLGFFGIAHGQLMPNSWRIVVNCMKIWLAANEDMIKVGELEIGRASCRERVLMPG